MYKRLGKKPRFPKPGLMHDEFDRGCLSPDGFPIRAHQGLPLTISTKIEGWRLDAIMRHNPAITMPDIRARMLYGTFRPDSSLSNRICKDRKQMRILPIDRPSYEHDRNFWCLLLETEMAGRPRALAKNSTRCLTDFTTADLQFLIDVSYGCSPPKAGNLSPQERYAKMRRNLQRCFSRGKTQDDAIVKHIRKSMAHARELDDLSDDDNLVADDTTEDDVQSHDADREDADEQGSESDQGDEKTISEKYQGEGIVATAASMMPGAQRLEQATATHDPTRHTFRPPTSSDPARPASSDHSLTPVDDEHDYYVPAWERGTAPSRSVRDPTASMRRA